jgi:uncharacterized protein YbjT (DUF2867 family)
VSVVDVRDIASVAVAALTQARHEGKTYDLTGPQALTHSRWRNSSPRHSTNRSRL